jgi:mRNA interferase RelE/StbE
LAKLPRDVQQRIVAALTGLEQNARPPGCKKLTEAGGAYRIRVGDYRVIYEVDDDRLVLEVTIVKIGNRADVYQFLKR